MLNYSRYLFSNIFSKKSFWITLILSIITLTVLGLFQISAQNEKGSIVVNTLTSFNKFLPFLFTTLITCLLVLYIFKDGEQDGSELLVVSKPIYRSQILAGKFFVLITMLVGVELLIFIDIFSYAQADTLGLMSERFRYAGSLAIGGLIIQLIIAAFLALFALFLGKVGILSIGIIGAAIIPIASMIISPISGGTPLLRLGEVKKKIHNKMVVNTKLDELADKIYEDKFSKELLDGTKTDATDAEYEELFNRTGVTDARSALDSPFIVSSPNKVWHDAGNEYFDGLWYDKAMYFDLWFQWSGFYDIIMGEKYVDANKIQRWHRVEATVNFDSKYSFDPKDPLLKNAFLVVESNNLNKVDFDIEKLLNIVKLYTTPGEPMNDKFRDKAITFQERMEDIKAAFGYRSPNMINQESIVAYKMIEKIMVADGTYVSPDAIRYVWTPDSGKNDIKDHWVWETGEKIELFKPTPFVRRSTKVYIWTSIALSALALTIFLYWRRDFK